MPRKRKPTHLYDPFGKPVPVKTIKQDKLEKHELAEGASRKVENSFVESHRTLSKANGQAQRVRL